MKAKCMPLQSPYPSFWGSFYGDSLSLLRCFSIIVRARSPLQLQSHLPARICGKHLQATLGPLVREYQVPLLVYYLFLVHNCKVCVMWPWRSVLCYTVCRVLQEVLASAWVHGHNTSIRMPKNILHIYSNWTSFTTPCRCRQCSTAKASLPAQTRAL